MSEKRILIASLLKPVNDTRMYEKLALSLSKLPEAEVHVCGFAAPLPASAPANIVFQPLFRFRRLSPGRFTAQLSYYNLLRSIKPDVVIACTHELLLASHVYCRKYKARLIYDVQENYALNLRRQHNYQAILKQVLAFGVESIEKFVAPAVDHFILAEQCYATELKFLHKRYTVLENKYKKHSSYSTPATPVRLQEAPLRLLYSGTISREYGILEAIALADKLYALDPDTTLTVIGYCAHSETWQQVKQQVKDKAYISVIGGEELVPHTAIIEVMQQSNVGLLPYQPNESTFSCIPTKLYEYMAHALIILISHNPIWQAIVQQHQAGLSADFKSINGEELYQQLKKVQFYTSGIPRSIFWSEEEHRLLKILQNIVQEHN